MVIRPTDVQSYDENLARLAQSVKKLEAGETSGGLPLDIAADFEDLAQIALRDFIGTMDHIGAGSSQLQADGMSAAIISTTGIIEEVNAAAATRFGLKSGCTLAECNLRLLGNSKLSHHMNDLLQQQQDAHRYCLLQVFGGQKLGVLTMVMSVLPVTPVDTPRFLIMFSAKQNLDEAVKLLATKFSLSRVETEIASAFLHGNNLRQIAQDRRRSYTTIRNQFQTVLEKTDCSSQSDLIQFVTNLSTLFANSKSVLKPAIETVSEAMLLPRPSGRKLEVLISGDPQGISVLNIFSLFGPGVTPLIDKKLKARGVCLISLWRPGFSNTSKPLKGQDRTTCLAGDIAAVLDSMGIEKCAWLARAASSQSFYDAALILQDRITHGVVVNGLVPRKYIAEKSVASKWTNVLMSASLVSYPVARMILGAGERLLRRSDPVSFLQKMYGHSEVDKERLGDADVVASILEGVKGIVNQGLDAGVHDIVSGFGRWDTDLDALRVPITVYHGVDDPNVPCEGVAEFVQDHSASMTMVTEQGGGQLCYSHFDRVLDLLLESK